MPLTVPNVTFFLKQTSIRYQATITLEEVDDRCKHKLKTNTWLIEIKPYDTCYKVDRDRKLDFC